MKGPELKARRLALGLSQYDLGRLLGVTANTVARWERGEMAIGHPDLLRTALESLYQRKLAGLSLAPALEDAGT